MIAIVKYNAGNIRSVQNALNRLGVNSIISDKPEELQSAEKVIFPGVGEASSAMSYLKKRGLDTVIKSLDQPVLGICLGLQLMCKWSEEGNTNCLGIFPNEVIRFQGNQIIPHIGWNDFTQTGNQIFRGLSKGQDVYYVHSYYAEPGQYTTAVCDYITPFSAAIHKDNFYATQFHSFM